MLDCQDDRYLLISDRVLDSRTYDVTSRDTTWEKSFLRNWLNSKFLSSVFSDAEQKMLLPVTLPADKNPDHRTDPGKETVDRVFLLSVEEVNRYFENTNKARLAHPTDSARRRHVTTFDKTNAAAWWLRTPGHIGSFASIVVSDGSFSTYGCPNQTESIGVRPAVWIRSGK